MARFLLDTNVLSEPLAPKPDAATLRRLGERSPESVTAAPVVHELRFGASLLEPSRRRDAIERYIDDVVLRLFPVLPYDQAAAEWHARERARQTRIGRPPPWVDGVIASIARVNDLVLVTENVKDFKRFSGLRLESWRAPRR